MAPQERRRSGDGLSEKRSTLRPTDLFVSQWIEGERLKAGSIERREAGSIEILSARHEWGDEVIVGPVDPEDSRLLRTKPIVGTRPLGVAAMRGPRGLAREGAQVIIRAPATVFSIVRQVERVGLVGPLPPDRGGAVVQHLDRKSTRLNS